MSQKIHNLIHTKMRCKNRTKNLRQDRSNRVRSCIAPVKVYKDSSLVLSKEQLKELELIHQDKLHSFQRFVENISLPRVSEEILEQFKRSINPDKRHYWITWTFDKKYAYCDYETRRDVALIRRKLIRLFFPNDKSVGNQRPEGMPKMIFIIEKHLDGQYHIHMMMEELDPVLIYRSLERNAYWQRWSSICSLIQSRPRPKQMVIDKRMLDVHPEYIHHPYINRTFSSISSFADGWLVSRFLCEYIFRNSTNVPWGLKRLSNSPSNHHSKLIESREEVLSKCHYMNKEQYFKRNDDFLHHLIPELSDLDPLHYAIGGTLNS